MKLRTLATLPLMLSLLLTSRALAEHPIDEVRAFNINRLLTTNLCPDCNLAGADLRGAHLIGADLSGADLSGADLSWVNLEGADLTKANLEGADLTGAFLTNAILVDTDLDDVNFTQAQLYFVDVTGASMENINLAGATVVGTPISIGNGVAPNEQEGSIIDSPEFWQLNPPEALKPLPSDRLDVPEQVMPEH